MSTTNACTLEFTSHFWVNMFAPHCIGMGGVAHFFLDGWMGWIGPCDLTLTYAYIIQHKECFGALELDSLSMLSTIF